MNQEQENAIKFFMGKKLAEGISLSDIQTLVNKEFDQHFTYMDIRILASELENVDWQALDPHAAERAKQEAKEKAEQEAAAAQAAEDADAPAEENAEEAAAPAGGQTVVELSKLARPGMMLSGTVTFASGGTAEWFVDNTGHLGLDKLQGPKPTQQDLEAFQIELDKVARKAFGR